jgi:prepilin-type N-terminal cleavage/methylation domain-containing protein
MTKNKGFTLIEILIVITLTVILFGIGLAQYMNFNRLQILEQAAQELKNNLRLAQTKAANGEKPDGCGVLNGYRVSFFSGDPYTYTIQAICGGNPAGAVKTFSLPSVVEISSLPPPIVF